MKIPTLTAIAAILSLAACADTTGQAPVTTSALFEQCAAAVRNENNLDRRSRHYSECMASGGTSSSYPWAPVIAPENNISAPPAQGLEKVQITKRGDTYYVPVRINDTITIPFLLDTGAGDLAIPEDVARTLIRAGALKNSDFIGKRSYQIANGSEEVSALVRIREVRVGEHVVRNVTAGITPHNGEPLLGQSFLSKFGAVTIDYKRLVLVLSP